MATKTDYQSAVALFAMKIEGVLSKIEQGKSSLFKSHIKVLRTVLAFIGLELNEKKKKNIKIDLKGLFNLDTELHKVQKFLIQVSVDDSNLVGANVGLEADDELARALKLFKILINLSKFRIENFRDPIFICITIVNNIGLITPRIDIPKGAGADERIMNEVVVKFLNYCKTLPNFQENESYDLDLSFDDADKQDSERISPVFSELNAKVVQNMKKLKNSKEVASMLATFRKVAESPKVGMLLTKGGMKNGKKFLQTLDEEILSIHYEKNSFSKRIKVDMVKAPKNKLLGEGLMGKVIVGKVGSQAAAFKSLNIDKDINGLSSEARTELMTELRLKWIKHDNENILMLHGVGLIDGNLYIAYELMQTSLESVLHGSKGQMLDETAVSQAALAISKGLKFLHQNSIIHSSLHPGNILLRGLDNYGKLQVKELRVKLTDFGTQKLKNDLEGVVRVTSPTLGLKLKLTDAYRAPEVLTDDKLTYASDIYALAIVIWEMGQDNERPFKKISNIETAVVKQKHRPNLSTSKTIKPWLKEFVEECWAHEPWLRPTAQDAQRKVEHELAFEESQGGGITDFRGRNLNNPPKMARLALPSQGGRASVNRQSGSRLSRVRMSTQKAHVRPSSQARNSVVLQKQRFAFLDDISENTPADVGIKILKAMRFYATDAELQVRGLVGLRRLLAAGNREKVIGRMGAGLLAIRAIFNHLKEVAVVEPAVGLIGNLAMDDRVAEALMRSGGAQAVLNGLLEHKNDEAEIEESMIAFTNLHQSVPERQRFILEIEAPRAIIHAMEAQAKSPSALVEAFAAVSYLQSGWYDGQVPSKKILAEKKKKYKGLKQHYTDFYQLKAQKYILKGMETFKENKELQTEGFNALAAIVSGQGYNDRRKALIKNEFLLTHVTKMFERHSSNPEVLEAGCVLLAELASMKEYHQRILKLDIHVFIISALGSYTEEPDESLQLNGIKVLFNLCYKDKKACKKMKDCDALEAAVRSSTLYPNNAELDKYANSLALVIARGGKV